MPPSAERRSFRHPGVAHCLRNSLYFGGGGADRHSEVALPAGIFDIGTLADLSNIGTLFAFVLVALGVLILRRRQPDRKRGFRVPWVPFIPVASVLCCLVLMASLPLETWVRFGAWLVIGLCIYFGYSRHRSEFAEK